MKAVTYLLAFMLVCVSGGAKSAKAAQVPVIYTFYDSSQDIYIYYNPGNGSVSDVYFGSVECDSWSSNTSTITWNPGDQTISVSGYPVVYNSSNYTIWGLFERIN